MQHLQLLVGREDYRYWCGGRLPREKLPGLVAKFASRYPIGQNTRQRAYARSRERAVVQFVAFPDGEHVYWWLLSTAGPGGLADPAMPDAHVASNAHAAAGHIEFRDYVLLYATKKEPRKIVDRKTQRETTVLKDTSTWTWKMRAQVMSELRAGIRQSCDRLEYGDESRGTRSGWGLRGLLAAQRERPLFAGIRTQVIELHREALKAWDGRRMAWLAKNPGYATKYGDQAGKLRPIKEVVAGLPKMIRLPVFDGKTLSELCKPAG
ncbi:hypothetical protein [Roseateles sp. BYS96W]|uniref:Transposase n=1 Tax=Pelomonas nitida TaxID=3299027 RepID=A0ABW7G8X1_9BURK